VDVGDLASLLPGIASIITALGGVWIGHRALKTGSRRERDNAARHAIDRVLGDDDDQDDEDRGDARAELLKRLRELEEEGGDS
jgi:hypothetical protein